MKMKKKRNRKRIAITSICILLLLVLIALSAGANYLVSFAIGRHSGTIDVTPETTLSDDALSEIHETHLRQEEQAKA